MPDEHESGASPVDPREILASLRRRDAIASSPSERYERLGEVATGGMGIILAVRDREMRRRLAMKVLRSRPGDDAEQSAAIEARFLEEAQLTSQLDHPGIVPVHEMGIDADGRLFFTMRLVKGKTLQEVFDLVPRGDEGWSMTRALGVMLKVCEAMAYAHERDVVHRDLKPANVMVGRFGETYVMDWGLAKVLGSAVGARDGVETLAVPRTVMSTVRKDAVEAVEESPLLTLDGSVLGTPNYMPPEQARGELESVDRRADVYAVGAMLHHLLSGAPPYAVDGRLRPPAETLADLLDGPPAPIPSRDTPAELIAICEHAMARECDARYANMQAFADDLRAFLEHRVVQAHATGAWAELRKWFERNRLLASGLAASFLVALVSLGLVGWVQARARGRLADANEGLREAELMTREALGVAERERAEARWSSYVANIVAAGASLHSGAAFGAVAHLDACEPEHRGFEWEYLSNYADTSVACFTPAPGTFVLDVAWSSAGTLAVSVGPVEGIRGAEPRVLLYDAESHELIRELARHELTVQDMCFSANGSRLVSASPDAVVLWDVASGEILWESPHQTGFPTLRPDGGEVAIAWFGLSLFDVEAESWRYLIQDVPTRCVAYSPDGSQLVCGLRDGGLLLLDRATGEVAWRVELKDDEPVTEVIELRGVLDVCFLEQGGVIAAALDSGAIVLIDAESGAERTTLYASELPVKALATAGDPARLAAASVDGAVHVWDLVDTRTVERLHGHADRVTSIAFAPDGEHLVTGSLDQTVRVWEALRGAGVTLLQGELDPYNLYYSAEFGPRSDLLAWRPAHGQVRVSDARSGLALFDLDELEATPLEIAFAPDGEHLYTVSSPGHVRTWSASTGELLEVSAHRLPELMYVHFSPDRTRFAACTNARAQWEHADGESIQVRSTADGSLLFEIPDVVSAWFVRFGPRGERLYVGHLDGKLRAYDAQQGTLLLDMQHDAYVHDIAPDPFGARVASTTHSAWDKTLYIWDARSGTLLHELRGPAQPRALTWTPDGRRIASANWDGSVTIWDPERGQILGLRGHATKTRSVRFSPDGGRLVTGDASGRHLVWETTSAVERAEPRLRLVRERKLEAGLRPSVAALYRDLFLEEEVVRALLRDAELSDEERACAVRLARLRPWDDGGRDLSLRVAEFLAVGVGTPSEYVRALRFGEWMRHTVDRRGSSRAHWAETLYGLALIRMGRPDEALAALAPIGGVGELEADLVPLHGAAHALALTEVGRRDEARAVLASTPADGAAPDGDERAIAAARALRVEVARSLD